MQEKNIINLVEDYVINLIQEKGSSKNVYHDLSHTKGVVKSVIDICSGSDCTENEKEILTIAAWFHDVGYVSDFKDHEAKSIKYAESFLSSINYAPSEIEKISDCIMATKMPTNPSNELQKIICDADLSHLGSKEFFNKIELFRVEYENFLSKHFSDIEWLELNIEFLMNQKFYTKYARENYEHIKNENLLKLKKKYRKKLDKKSEEKIKNEKIEIEKKKLISKQESGKKAERGIETMFRNTLRTHVSFSSMADSKANIMISVNTLLLGAIATILSQEISSNPHLIVPTLVLTIVSLTTLIYAILVTRPKVTSGVFSKEDIQKKRVNLLFFGNFYNMNLEDFSWGMKELIQDKEFLYDSMIKDFYYLGQVLGKKYKNLRICYTIFMYGFILSIILFIVFILLNPGSTNINIL